MTAEERSKNIKSMYENLDAIPPPDITPINQYEVYTTFCSIVPRELKYYYQKPLDEVMHHNKNRLNKKREEYAEKKEL